MANFEKNRLKLMRYLGRYKTFVLREESCIMRDNIISVIKKHACCNL